MVQRFQFRNKMAESYDSVTQERRPWGAYVLFEDEFLGFQFIRTETGSTAIWSTVEVLLNTAIGILADQAGGVLRLVIDVDNNAEDAVIYWGNQRAINLKAGAVFECRAKLSVIPTLTTEIVFGMAGDHNLDKDTISEAAWFKFDGSAAALAESDDTTNNNDDISTGVTVLTTEYRIYRIDFTNLANVLFFIDGVGVATATTFDMSNLTDAEAIMQPYISMDKGADTGVATFDIDYVRVWSKRTA